MIGLHLVPPLSASGALGKMGRRDYKNLRGWRQPGDHRPLNKLNKVHIHMGSHWLKRHRAWKICTQASVYRLELITWYFCETHGNSVGVTDAFAFGLLVILLGCLVQLWKESSCLILLYAVWLSLGGLLISKWWWWLGWIWGSRVIEELGGVEGVLCSLVKVLFSIYFEMEEKSSK